MSAARTSATAEKLEPKSITPARTAYWRLAGQFSTMEMAERKIRELREQGISCTLCMIGGLSVLMRAQQGA